MAGTWNERFENAKEDLSKDVRNFLQLTEELEEIATKVTSKQRSKLKNMKTKVDGILQIVNRGQMKVAFFGRTSNGKSTVINALLGTKVLPSACGSVSSCFCTIEGRRQFGDIIYHKGMAKVGKVQYDNLQSARSLASHLSQEHLGVNDVLEIYWPTQDCELLQANVVLVDRLVYGYVCVHAYMH
jgi:mitofusin